VARFGEKMFCCGMLVGSGVPVLERTGEDSVEMKLLLFLEYYLKDCERYVHLIGGACD